MHPDYDVEVHKHFYSVPYHLIGQEVDVRLTPTVVEILFQNMRVASHKRDRRPYKHTTLREHMRKAHQKYADWTPERLTAWASRMGPATRQLITNTLESAGDHPQQRFRRCLGVLSLEKDFGAERLEAVCERAQSLPGWSPSSLRSMHKHGLDRKVVQLPLLPNISHENIRGPEYYQHDEEVSEQTDI